MRKGLKFIGLLLGGAVLLLLLVAAAFINLSPEFGGTPSKAQLAAYAASGHYREGEFVNQLPTEVMTGTSTLAMLRKFLFTHVANKTPAAPLAVQPLDSLTIVRKDSSLLRVTWFGHSASLVEIAGHNILLDPMLSLTMGPSALLTPDRYSPALPITPAQLPPIAAVLISHDHYDHLDYHTISQIKDKVAGFYVPLGVGAHLVAWGVAPARIHEMSWGDSVQLPGLRIVCTPSRHFSGRGLSNRNSTLWSSWVLKGSKKRVFYSGDGGYGPHFQAIGASHGPFDLALMECGQYDAQWSQIHMMPEQSVQAARDVRAQAMLPVHWGAFTEANHAWTEPVERAAAAAARQHLPLATPRLGEPLVLDGRRLPPGALVAPIERP
jgi:L-ascorbate metabolism protein UlaG (beta-lactamase superfamily)